jgi:hypothetical protein
MTKPPEIKYIEVPEALVGYGATRDLALNELLQKLRLTQLDLGCGNEGRPQLNPPDNIKFRAYWQNGDNIIRWKCFWGPGVLEIECAPTEDFEDWNIQ